MEHPCETPLPLAAYDLAPPVAVFEPPRRSANNTLLSVRTGAGEFLWKTIHPIHTAASIAYEHRLLARIAGAGLSFAVPAPLPARDGTTFRRTPQGWGALVPCLPGVTPDPTRLEHVEAIGAALGELHIAMQHLPTTPRPGRPLFEALFSFPLAECDPLALTPGQLGLAGDPQAAALLAWWRSEAARLKAFAEGPYRALPWQLCHNDVAPANLLLEGGRITAVLDFEFACPAARALDLAMGLRMTMRVWENPDPWDAARRLLHGYTRRLAPTGDEIRALPHLILLRSAIPVLWWLGRMGTTTPESAQTVIRGIGYLRNAAHWLERHAAQLVEVVAQAAATPA